MALVYPKTKKSFVQNFVRENVRRALSSINSDTGDLENFHSDSRSFSSRTFRVVWFLVGLLCFFICCYQVYDRVEYYNSSPTTTDVATTDDPIKMPPLRLGGVDTDAMKYFWNLSNVNVSQEHCHYLLQNFFKGNLNNTNYNELWAATDFMPNVEKIFIQEGTKILSEIIFDKGIVLPSSLNPQLVKWRRRDTVWGAHTVFEIAEKISLQTSFNIALFHTGYCGMSGFLFASEKLIPYHHVTTSPFGVDWQFMYSIEENKFLNTHKSPCGSDDDLKKCYHKCIIKKYETFQCRMPFTPPEVNKIDCTELRSLNTAKVVAESSAVMIAETSPLKDCNCRKSCIQQIINYKIIRTEINDKSKLEFHYVSRDNKMTKTQEKIIYDGINLLVDVGGSLCLFLGLCLLSIIKIIHLTAFNFFGSTQDTTNNVDKKYFSLIQRELIKILQLKKATTMFWINSFKTVILTILISSFAVLTYLKIMFYFSHPTTTKITTTEIVTVYLPNIIVCGENNETILAKEKYAVENNIDICNVDFIDLLPSVANGSTEILWKFKRTYLKRTVVKPFFTAKEIEMHGGTCYDVTFNSSHMYSDQLVYTRLDIETFLVNNCLQDPLEVYIRSPGTNIYSAISSKLDITTGSCEAIFFETFRVHRYNSPSNPCVNATQFEICSVNCYETKIQQFVDCRLPFMTNINRPRCTSVTSSKNAYRAYLEVVTRTDVQKDCDCKTPCYMEMHKRYWFMQLTLDANYSQIFVTPLSNVIINLNEISTYSLVALLCDFGNILGITLGLSVLSISHITLSFYNTLHSRYIKKTTK